MTLLPWEQKIMAMQDCVWEGLSPATVLGCGIFFWLPELRKLQRPWAAGWGKDNDAVLIRGFTFPSPVTKALSIYLEKAHKFPATAQPSNWK